MTPAETLLVRAAQDALYYLSIGDQFNEVKRCEKFLEVHKRLSEAMMGLKYEGMSESDIQVERAMRRSRRREWREQQEWLGHGPSNSDTYNPGTGEMMVEGPFVRWDNLKPWSSDRGGRL